MPKAIAEPPTASSHLQSGTPEWDESFERLEATLREHPVMLDDISDEEINAIVHEVRAERHAATLGH